MTCTFVLDEPSEDGMSRMRHVRGLLICLIACINIVLIALFNQSLLAHSTANPSNAILESGLQSAPLRVHAAALFQTTQLTETEPVTQVTTLLDTIIESTANGSAVDELYSEAIDGTIFANRTSASVTIFVEGELYRLAPLRSLGINIQRSPASINMFNCDADTATSESACFWDLYLVDSDGFYEVFNTAADGAPLQLVLQEASDPDENIVWIQNRTGQREILVFEDELYELPPATVQEFDVEANSIAIFYRRSCMLSNDGSACEWIPQEVETGFYYALNEPPNSENSAGLTLSTAEIRPIVAQDSSTNRNTDSSTDSSGESSTVVEQPRQTLCQVQVPRLNVRSGPGLNYIIVSTISLNGGASGGRVPAIGRDQSGQWIAVDQSVALGGWVTSSRQLITCDGDIAALPITEITDGRLVPTSVPVPTSRPASPTPAPVALQPAPQNPAPQPVNDQSQPDDIDEEPAPDEVELSPEEIEIPPGQLKLVVQNVFEHEVRFTLSPDEFDLQPGETITLVRAPGRLTFTVSSPWRGLSGNAELTLDGNQSFSMFLYFIPKPGKSDEWEMKYQ